MLAFWPKHNPSKYNVGSGERRQRRNFAEEQMQRDVKNSSGSPEGTICTEPWSTVLMELVDESYRGMNEWTDGWMDGWMGRNADMTGKCGRKVNWGL